MNRSFLVLVVRPLKINFVYTFLYSNKIILIFSSNKKHIRINRSPSTQNQKMLKKGNHSRATWRRSRSRNRCPESQRVPGEQREFAKKRRQSSKKRYVTSGQVKEVRYIRLGKSPVSWMPRFERNFDLTGIFFISRNSLLNIQDAEVRREYFFNRGIFIEQKGNFR